VQDAVSSSLTTGNIDYIYVFHVSALEMSLPVVEYESLTTTVNSVCSHSDQLIRKCRVSRT
jgi:hypothetical protein